MAKRRSPGEGNVQKLKSGNWRGQLMDGYTEEGKKKIVSLTAPTKAEVLKKMREYRSQVDDHIHLSKALTLAQWAQTWYADYQSQVQPSTYSGYKFTLKIIQEHLGDNKLCDTLPIHINRFLDDLVEQNYSLSQIKKCRTMLIQIFNAAEDNGLVSRNPAQRAKVMKGKDNRLMLPMRKKDAFTEEEVALFLEKLPTDLIGNSIRTMLGTGMRVQELLALTPDDIEENGASIKVDKAIKMVGGIATLGPPKSPKSYRTIPVPDEYRAYVQYLREHGGRERIWTLSGKNPYYSVGSFRRRFYTAIGTVEGIRKLTPHCCRHTYITRLQAKGVPMETISKLAGHSDTDTTTGYLHLSDATLERAVQALNTEKRTEMNGNGGKIA